MDSMGDVNLMSGRFREAEEFYQQSGKKNPNFQNGISLWKAAFARLMSGDVQGADGLAKQYFDGRTAARDPLVGYYQANWAWTSGRRKAAVRHMEQWAGASESGQLREVASRAYGTAAIWRTLLGDREGALPLVQRSISTVGPSSAAIALSARFLSQPAASAAEWNARLEQALPNVRSGGARDLLLVDALLLSKQYAAALPLLQKLYESSGDFPDSQISVTLAWTLIETGKSRDAEAFLRLNPVPDGNSPFFPFYFPRLFFLRAELAKAAGQPDEARRNYDLFLKLSGPDPLIWGEEAKTRAAK
jgi:tetratricopeptide (TPR) repeat protein